jgi:hypothetical protein
MNGPRMLDPDASPELRLASVVMMAIDQNFRRNLKENRSHIMDYQDFAEVLKPFWEKESTLIRLDEAKRERISGIAIREKAFEREKELVLELALAEGQIAQFMRSWQA